MLENKKILLISPQAWGKMFVAKHHYAVQLANRNNQVYFLNPPDFKGLPFVNCRKAEDQANLWIVDHGTFFPTVLRFKMRKIYDGMMSLYVKWLVKKLGNSFDIVWCFEPNLYSNLDWFGAKKIIYHPVDELFYSHQLVPGKKADLIISVTNEILSKFPDHSSRKMFLNHGVTREFYDAVSKNEWRQKENITIGYSGNLLRPDIDFATIKKCVQQFPNARFIFWGNYKNNEGNLPGNDSEELANFVNFLQSAPNVVLKGQVAARQLATEYEVADIFLICYDINKDQSRGTNYHKVMEYLATGKVIVSNNITTYRDSELLRMCKSRTNNEEFCSLLADTINNISYYNSQSQQEKRKVFAIQNIYGEKIEQISDRLLGKESEKKAH